MYASPSHRIWVPRLTSMTLQNIELFNLKFLFGGLRAKKEVLSSFPVVVDSLC